jgi:hypothetical protein
MAFDETTVMGILSGEGTSEEKYQKINAEYESDRKGLETSKNKILEEKKALQKSYDEYPQKFETEMAGYKTRIQELEERAKKGGSKEAEEAYNAQLKREKAVFDESLLKSKAENEELNKNYTSLLEKRRLDLVRLGVENAMSKLGVTVPEDRDNMMKVFLYEHGGEFKPGENDDIPVNGEYKTIQEVMNTLAVTSQYQRFIPNKNTGGGATGSTSTTGKQNTISREKYDQLSAQEKAEFVNKGGKIG